MTLGELMVMLDRERARWGEDVLVKVEVAGTKDRIYEQYDIDKVVCKMNNTRPRCSRRLFISV